MKRFISKQLIQWKNSHDRKPLVLKGARQVGKTYSLLEFGKEQYEMQDATYHYIDFRKHKKIYSIFEQSVDPEEIIKYLQFRLNIQIDTDKDLLIFDEIQECPEAITCLKYFRQEMNSLDIVTAGSHLGLLKSKASFPVGKVNFMYMHPLNFNEFIMAYDLAAYDELEKYDLINPMPTVVHERLLELIRLYMFTGGLPEVVSVFLRDDSLSTKIASVRKKQKELISGYYSDFAKYSGVVNSNHIKSVFESIPFQLSKNHDESSNKYLFNKIALRPEDMILPS